MADPQTLIRDAQEKAERLCARAVEQTPVDYQSFITLIEQRKKVGGTRHAPVFAAVRQPYLSVDGRVKWARDEHLRAGKRFDVHTEFVAEPTSGQLLARATLTSEIYGTVVAHARVFLGGDGVNESNPLETGETSALGRALGMWGFGCYGTGIASAEEVLRVGERPDPGAASPGGPRPPNGAPGTAPSASVAAAVGVGEETTEPELARLGQALGLRPGEVALRRAQAGSDQEAIEALRAELAARGEAGTPNTGDGSSELAPTRIRPGELLAHAARLGVGAAAYRAYLVARYALVPGETPEASLTDDQLRQECARFARREREPAIGVGFRLQCEQLVRRVTP
jgi:hypothetical protein